MRILWSTRPGFYIMHKVCSKDAHIDQMIPKVEVGGHFVTLLKFIHVYKIAFLGHGHNVTPCFQYVIPWKLYRAMFSLL